jgi:predicted ferric reductase
MNAIIKNMFFRQYTIIFVGIPILIWALNNLSYRSLFKESLSVLTILVFCLMIGMFFCSRLNPYAVKKVKMAKVIKFHKIIGYTCMTLLLFHPVFLIIPRFFESGCSPVDAFVTIVTTFNQGVILGILAWSLMLIIGITSLTRRMLPMGYKTWRSLHSILAGCFIFIATWHVIDLGRHSSHAMSMFIIIMTAGNLLLVGKHTLLKTIKPTGVK